MGKERNYKNYKTKRKRKKKEKKKKKKGGNIFHDYAEYVSNVNTRFSSVQFNVALRPQRQHGQLDQGRGAQSGHVDFHTAPGLIQHTVHPTRYKHGNISGQNHLHPVPIKPMPLLTCCKAERLTYCYWYSFCSAVQRAVTVSSLVVSQGLSDGQLLCHCLLSTPSTTQRVDVGVWMMYTTELIAWIIW